MTGMRFCRPPPSISPAITAISVRWEEVADQVKDRAVVWAIDVAKVEQYGVLMDSERQVVVTLRWAHPAETPALLERLRGEAALQRHWPELTHYLELDSVTLEDLLLSFGSPAELSAQAEEGRERMRRVSRGKLAAEKIEAVLESARQTIGVPCVAAERE